MAYLNGTNFSNVAAFDGTIPSLTLHHHHQPEDRTTVPVKDATTVTAQKAQETFGLFLQAPQPQEKKSVFFERTVTSPKCPSPSSSPSFGWGLDDEFDMMDSEQKSPASESLPPMSPPRTTSALSPDHYGSDDIEEDGQFQLPLGLLSEVIAQHSQPVPMISPPKIPHYSIPKTPTPELSAQAFLFPQGNPGYSLSTKSPSPTVVAAKAIMARRFVQEVANYQRVLTQGRRRSPPANMRSPSPLQSPSSFSVTPHKTNQLHVSPPPLQASPQDPEISTLHVKAHRSRSSGETDRAFYESTPPQFDD